MRVAVCLSGQPRCYRESFPFIYKHIIEPNNADVFFHTWFDKSDRYMEKIHMDRGACEANENTVEELLALYKPKDFLVEKQREFYKPNIEVNDSRLKRVMTTNKHRNWNEQQTKKHIIKQHLSMLYSIYKSNELKENYANHQGIVYDFVIRLRFDCIPLAPIHLSRFDPNLLYYQDLGHPDELVSDWINFGSNLIMNVYSTTFFYFEYLNSPNFYKLHERLPNTYEPSTTSGGFAEFMIRDMATLHKIPTCKVDMKCILSPST